MINFRKSSILKSFIIAFVLSFYLQLNANEIALDNVIIPSQSSLNSKINFKTQILIDKNKVSLSDILTDESKKELNKEMNQILNEVVISEAPKPGESLKYSNYALSEIIRHQIKNSQVFSQVTFSIPKEIIIHRKNKMDIKDMEALIRQRIQKECSECEIEISKLRVNNLPESDSFEWSISNLDTIPRGAFTIPVDLIKNGKVERKVWLQGQSKIFRKIPIARRDIPTGIKIQNDDFEFQRRDVTFERNAVPTEIELIGGEVSVFTAANQPLWKRNLKRQLAVVRGAPVVLLIRNQGFRIQAKAVAQDNGYVGDLIKIQNPETKKILSGFVLDNGQVEMK